MAHVITTGSKKTITLRTQAQYEFATLVRNHAVTFCNGPAGTGKTLLAVALALEALRAQQVNRIIISRPLVECGENLGSLPGTIEEKSAPYLRPIYDAFAWVGSEEKTKVEAIPLAFMRGLNFHDSFVIVDEVQNATKQQIQAVLTRLHESSKCVIVGDKNQVDLHNEDSFARICEYLEENPLKYRHIAYHKFKTSDIQRGPVVSEVLNLIGSI